MNKEKQIDIVSRYHAKNDLANALYQRQDEFDLSNPFEVAKAVINLGYRKIKENEVVISKDNYETYKQVLSEWSIMQQEKFNFNKPNENEVVISKEEYELLIKNKGIEHIQEFATINGKLCLVKDKMVLKEYPPDAVNFIRKETAREIYRELQGHGTTYVKKWLKEQFGVDIGETK